MHGVNVVLHDFKGACQYATNYERYSKDAAYDPYGLTSMPPMGRGDIALDVGANLGLVAILLAKKAREGGARVFALEPHPALFRYLLWNLRDNNVTNVVWPLRLGGCDFKHQGPRFFTWPWWDPRAMRIALSGLPEESRRSLRTKQHSRCVSLPDLMRALGLRRKTLAVLKVDCEGCEWGFLGGDGGAFLLQALRAGRITRLVGELHHAGRFRWAGPRGTLLRGICTNAFGAESGATTQVNFLPAAAGSRIRCRATLERCGEFLRECRPDADAALATSARELTAAAPEGEIKLTNAGITVGGRVRLATAIAMLRRFPAPDRGRRVLHLLATWRPRDNVDALRWAVGASGDLDTEVWRRSASVAKLSRRFINRVSGNLLCKVSVALARLGDANGAAQLASRAMELLRRAGAHGAARRFFASSRAVAPWVHPWQTPTRYVRGLRALPVWSAADLRAEREGEEPPAAALIAEALEANFLYILEDFRRIRARRWPPAYGPELIHQPHNWTKFLLYDGDLGGQPPPGFPGQPYRPRELHSGLCQTFAPHTCDLIRKLLPGLRHPELPYLQPDHEQVAFFHLAAGSHIQFHQASQNARLTIHLCLSGCGGTSRIQVGPRVLYWKRGGVLVFDDSFLHGVRIDPGSDRWILHVMTTHPGIDRPELYAHAINEGRVWPA